MAAVGSRDGREIVLALDACARQGLDRDGEGRYLIKQRQQNSAAGVAPGRETT